jgi:hypothetical protein
MSGQKTAAKWLIIILLVSISVFSYAMYDSFFVSDGGNVQGSDDQTENPPDNPPLVNDEEPPQIVYSEFPRAAETIGDFTVQHTGGSGEDILLKSHRLLDKTFAIVETSSNSFDFRAQNHLALALFDDGSLLKTSVFSDASELYLDSKPTASGLAILSQAADGALILRKFSNQIEKIGQVRLDFADEVVRDAKLYLDGSALSLFVLTDLRFRAVAVLEDLTTEDICAPADTEGIKIVSLFKYLQNYIVALSGETQSRIYLVNPNGMFLEKSFDFKTLSLGVYIEEQLPFYILCAKTVEGVRLVKLNVGFGEVSNLEIAGAQSAVVSKQENMYIAVTESAIHFLCPHLNLLFSQSVSALIGESATSAAYALSHAGKSYFLLFSLNSHRAHLIGLDGVKAEDIFSFSAEDGEISLFVSPEKIMLLFSTALGSGIYSGNFGAKDVYFVSINRNNAT